jgi:hypothetical protein
MGLWTYRDSWKDSVSQVECVGDAHENQLRVVEVRPLEQGVQHLLESII